MARYRDGLPQLASQPFLTDGGLETTLLFHERLPLPHFAAFDLLRTEAGTNILKRYYESYAALAVAHGMGLILDSASWRASPDWGAKLGYDAITLAEANRRSIALLEEIRTAAATESTPMVISGALGPRGDGYRTESRMSSNEAMRYHQVQVHELAETEADMLTAFTINYVEEAIGIAMAARRAAMPAVISFTLETDGRLPSGQTLPDAIQHTDDATDGYPQYYMINCAHPAHFAEVLRDPAPWRERIRGIRANASRRSHAELDESPDLDIGNPLELAEDYRTLRRELPHMTIFGGCCGTDLRHVSAIATALQS